MILPRRPRSLPATAGRRRLIVAASVDTLGVGLFLPLSFYYFTVTTTLPIVAIGAVTSAATLTALLVSPWAGTLTVRHGPKAVAVASNLVTACGYLGYLFVHSLPLLFAAVFIVMAGDRLYFAAWPTLVAEIADEGELDAWYALIQAAGAGSLGIGALVSGVLLAGSADVLRTLVVINALTSVAAGLVTASLRLPSARRETAPASGDEAVADAGGPRPRYRDVLRDHRFVQLLTGQILIATAWTMPGTFLPLYLVRTLHLPAWYAMAVFSTNYFLLFALQMSLTRLVRGIRRTVVLAIGAACFLATAGVIAAAPLAGRGAAFAVILAGIAVYSLGEMLCVPTGNALVAAHAPAAARGMYMAVFQLTGAIAFGVGPGVVGALFAVNPRLVLAAVAVFVTLGAFVFLSVDRPRALRPGGSDV